MFTASSRILFDLVFQPDTAPTEAHTRYRGGDIKHGLEELAEIGTKLGKQVLEEIATVAKPEPRRNRYTGFTPQTSGRFKNDLADVSRAFHESMGISGLG